MMGNDDDPQRSDEEGERHGEFGEEEEARMLPVGRVPFDVESGDSNYGGFGSVKNPISVPALLKTLFFIIVWYALSTCLTIYNKTLLGDKLGKFPAPLLMNSIHFAMQAILSNLVSWFQSSKITYKLSWSDYFVRVVPTATATALDINLSNISLVFISVTFATMVLCKSASPIFLLLFAFAFRLETPSMKLFGIIFIISVGVLLTVLKETEFELWGFIFVMLASVMSGFRWSMTQILLQKEAYGLENPITLMSYIAPVMGAITLILSFILDPWHDLNTNVYFDTRRHIARTLFVLLLGGILAFFMVLTEYILVSATSAVTITVAGVVKEAVTILVAVLYFHDEFSLLKGSGLVIIMVGVCLFNLYKYKKMVKGDMKNNEGRSSSSSSSSDGQNAGGKYVIIDEI